MPGRNGTGSMGAGAMTGKGFGSCTGADILAKGTGLGLGIACRRGLGSGFRRFFGNQITLRNRKEILQAQKDTLKSRLAAIDRQLENL